MGSYNIRWKKSAVKELKRIDNSNRRAIVNAVYSLSEKPRNMDIKKLIGSERSYRLRVRSYRVIYELFDDLLLIHIVRIKHRKDVYRK